MHTGHHLHQACRAAARPPRIGVETRFRRHDGQQQQRIQIQFCAHHVGRIDKHRRRLDRDQVFAGNIFDGGVLLATRHAQLGHRDGRRIGADTLWNVVSVRTRRCSRRRTRHERAVGRSAHGRRQGGARDGIQGDRADQRTRGRETGRHHRIKGFRRQRDEQSAVHLCHLHTQHWHASNHDDSDQHGNADINRARAHELGHIPIESTCQLLRHGC